eukprot:15485200-Alexandrium_andersonii.AAC.1
MRQCSLPPPMSRCSTRTLTLPARPHPVVTFYTLHPRLLLRAHFVTAARVFIRPLEEDAIGYAGGVMATSSRSWHIAR